MKIIYVKIEKDPISGTNWIYPLDESEEPLFKFITGGLIGISEFRWKKDIEPVLKLLGLWATISLATPKSGA